MVFLNAVEIWYAMLFQTGARIWYCAHYLFTHWACQMLPITFGFNINIFNISLMENKTLNFVIFYCSESYMRFSIDWNWAWETYSSKIQMLLSLCKMCSESCLICDCVIDTSDRFSESIQNSFPNLCTKNAWDCYSLSELNAMCLQSITFVLAHGSKE